MSLRLLQDHLTYGYVGKVYNEKQIPYFEKALFERLNLRQHDYEYSVSVKQVDCEEEDCKFDGEYIYETPQEVAKFIEERILKTTSSTLLPMVMLQKPITIESHKGTFEFTFKRNKNRGEG